MNDVNQTCSLCNKPNDQMLMLSCVHDPCINCAASAYAEHVYIKGHSKDVYLCEICGEETLLDTSTIAELNALASSVIKMPSKQIPAKSTNAPQPPRRKETQHPPQTQLMSSTVSTKKIIYYCKEHSQEEISYYCFTCWANICPQCAIHGSHKDHEVKLIKKAISQVKGEYIEIVGKVGDSQGAMGKLKEGFLRLIKEGNDRHAREKNAITREFDIIRAAMASKEKELVKELDDINKQNMAALTSLLEVINSNNQEASKLKRSVELITKKDDVLILEDYRKISELNEAILSINKTTQSLNSHTNHLNAQLLQQYCKELGQSIGGMKINQKREEIGASSISPANRPNPSPS